jgi:WD40 repeat protein
MKVAAAIVVLCVLLSLLLLSCKQRGTPASAPAIVGNAPTSLRFLTDEDERYSRYVGMGMPKDHVGYFMGGKEGVQLRVKFSITAVAPECASASGCLVSETNQVDSFEVDDFAERGGGGGKIQDDQAAKADKIVANLPHEPAQVPKDRRVLVAVPQGAGWKVHTYDSGNLPEEILELSRLVGAHIGTRFVSIEPKRELDTGFPHELWGGMALSPDGKVLVVNAYRSEIKAWSLPDLNPLDTFAKLPKLSGAVIEFSPDGKYLLATDGVARGLIVLDAKTGAKIATLDGWAGAAFTPDGKYITAPYRDKLSVYRVSDGQSVPAFGGLPEWVLDYYPSNDQKLAVIGGTDGKMQLWDVKAKKALATLDNASRPGSVKFSPNNSRVAVVAASAKLNQDQRNDYRIGVWDVKTGRRIWDLKPHDLGGIEEAGGILWSPDGRYVLADVQPGSFFTSHEVEVWDMATGRHRGSFTGPTTTLTGVTLTPDGKTLIVGSTDEKIRFYDLEASVKSIDAFVRSLPPLPESKQPATFASLPESVAAAGNGGGVLLVTDWLSFSAACVSRKRLDDKPSDQPMLQVWRGTSVEDASITGLPFSRLRVDERNLDDSIVNGKREAGGRSASTKMKDSGALDAFVVDGKEQQLYEGAYAAKLSPNGKHWAHCGIQWGFQTQFPIIDGEKGPEYDWCTGVVFSPDGDHWAYVAGNDGKAALVKDGKPATWRKCPRGKAVTIGTRNAIGQSRLSWEGSSGTESILWSPDSARVAFLMLTSEGASDADKRCSVFVDDKEMPVPAAGNVCSIDRLADWSPDSKRFAYAGWRDNQSCMVVDGEILSQSGEVRDFTFSQDGKQFAYLVRQKDSRLSVIRDGSTLDTFYPASLDGKTAWAYDINGIAFSPDGKHLAYAGRESKDGKWFVGMDGQRFTCDQILTKPIFEGDRLKFVALERGDKLIKIVVAEKSFSTTAPASPSSR